MAFASTATTKLELPGVAFITGGASGLGRGVALAFADLGAKIVIADVNATAGQEVADGINSRHSDSAIAVQTDVSDEEQVKNAVETTLQRFGRIDYAINSAGVVVAGDKVHLIKDTALHDFERTHSIDSRGVFLCMKYQLKAMLAQDVPNRPRASRGVIINLASRASLEGVPRFGAYCAAKHAVLGLSRVAAVEHAADKIRVVAVCPGLVKTPGHVAAAKEVDDMLLAQMPMGRWGTPDEITDGITFACSDMASFMSGNTLEIDGAMAAK